MKTNTLEFIWKIAIVLFVCICAQVLMNKILNLEARISAVEKTMEVK